jgi:hypothetical protein
VTEITAPAGFFWNDAVSPTTATDILTAVEAAIANVDGALASATAAAASATAAAASALDAMGSQTAASTSETNAATSASTAATSATAAGTSATAAATSATSASTSQTAASSSASGAATSATAAASSATAAANSATAAATSATAAATSATTASNAAATIPAPGGSANQYLRVNSSGNAYEKRTPAQAASDLGTLHDTGRNKLHNAMFNIWQRGAGAFTTLAVYTADRWLVDGSTDTVSVTRQALADADRTAIADEEATFCLQHAFSTLSGAGSYNFIAQRIENVRRLAGKTVTVSFYAKAASGTPKVGVSIDQNFGTGGSPSAAVNGTGVSVTLSTSWALYSLQIPVASISGKTLGTNSDSYTQLNLWGSSGSTNNTRAGSIGAQTNTIQFWGIQLEQGSIVTPREKIDPTQELAKCQRFYVGALRFVTTGMGNTTTAVTNSLTLPVTMRSAPSANAVANVSTNTGTVTLTSVNTTVWAQFTPPVSSGYIYDTNLILSADL